ncbi:S8 family serine peptidase [Marinobacter sp. MBR-105]|jgi:subtilisin family serine protease
MTFKKLTLAALVSAFALSGCGGGGGGGTDDTTVKPPVTPEVEKAPNEDAKALINASNALSATNVVIAVADAGVNTDHTEFESTAIDGRSASFSSELLLDGSNNLNYELQANLSDDHYPDYDANRDYAEASHGTYVASLIFGKDVGLLTDGTLLALDVVYSGSVDGGTFDPIGRLPDNLASIMATTEMAATNAVDFLNMSMEGAATYFKATQDGGLQADVYSAIEGSGVGVIAAAGNLALDYSEIYASSTPACTDEEMNAATGFAYERCYALKYDRNELDLVPYHNDTLRNDFILVVAIDDNKQVASFSNVPGAEPKIQQRFIAAPGVGLDVADHKDNADYTTASGTSFAAPLVTAAAGGVKAKFSGLSSAAVLQILLDTADSNFAGYDPKLHGVGILDVEAALNVNPNDYIGL